MPFKSPCRYFCQPTARVVLQNSGLLQNHLFVQIKGHFQVCKPGFDNYYSFYTCWCVFEFKNKDFQGHFELNSEIYKHGFQFEEMMIKFLF